MAEFIILDLPSQPSPATQAVVGLCNFIAVVTERELGSVISAKVALDQLQSWGVRSDFAGAVVVSRTEHPSPMKLTEIRSRLGCECFQSPQASAPGVLSMTDHAAAGFVEIASVFATDNLVGINL
jgi:Flp pilus assembly CpaE family ATPase